MNTLEKRSISERLFAFFTNDAVMAVAITLSTVFVFLSGYNLHPNPFLYIDAFFTVFFLIEALVKINCCNPSPGKNSLREKFRYYWFGKFDVEKQKEKRAAKGEDLDLEEEQIKAYRNKQAEKRKAKEKKRKKSLLRRYI